jgi:hypothetical protein
LRDDRIHRPSALGDISLQPAQESQIGVGVHKDLDIEEIAQGAVDKYQDPLDENDGTRLDAPQLRPPRMVGKIVRGHIDGAIGAQIHEMRNQKIRFKGIRVIVIDPRAFSQGQVAAVAIIRIMLQIYDAIRPDAFEDRVRNGRFARAGASGYSNEKRLHKAIIQHSP